MNFLKIMFQNYKQLSNVDLQVRIQKIVNQYCIEKNIDPILIKYGDNSGDYGGYVTWNDDGKNVPLYIKIYWSDICIKKSNYKEWIYILSHELAHHHLNVKWNCLAHNKMHDELWGKIDNYLINNIIKTGKTS